MRDLVPTDRIERAILLIRGQKVLLDRDLAGLYGVPTRALKQAVQRNRGRFPEDFMFVLTREELPKWRSQFVTSKSDRMRAPFQGLVQGQRLRHPVPLVGPAKEIIREVIRVERAEV